MNLDCTRDFILPKYTCNGINTRRPKSRLWVDDLAGLSTTTLANMEPGKYASADEMILEKVRVATERVMELVGDSVSKYILERESLEIGTLGEYLSASSTSTSKRGLRVKLGASGGILMKILVTRVWIKSKVSKQNVVLTITDDGAETEHTFNAVADQPVEVVLQYVSTSNLVDITITDPDVELYHVSTKGTQYYTSCSTCSGTAKYEHLAAAGVLAGVESTTEAHGIVAEVQAVCSFPSARCLLMMEYRWAILYQFGVEVCEEWEATPRMNFLGIHGKPWAIEKKKEWGEKVASIVAQKASKAASFLAQLSPKCVKCGTGVHHGYGF